MQRSAWMALAALLGPTWARVDTAAGMDSCQVVASVGRRDGHTHSNDLSPLTLRWMEDIPHRSVAG